MAWWICIWEGGKDGRDGGIVREYSCGRRGG